MRRAAKIDSNQKSIVNGLRRCGYSVFCTHQLGKGFPDIVVGAKNKNFLFEIKDSAKPLSKTKLTEGEDKFFQSWEGQVSIIRSIEDALLIINRNT